MNQPEAYLGLDGLNKLTFADLRSGDKLLSMLAVKLDTLDLQGLHNQMLEERVRFLMELLRETFAGRYQQLSASAFAHILVALDYFLKVRDKIPDTLPRGTTDDLSRVEEVFLSFKPELDAFRQWRVRQPQL